LPADLIVTKRNIDTLKPLADRGVHISNDNVAAVSKSNWIILAIKPFQMKEVLSQIQPALVDSEHCLISVVTGVWVKDIQEIVGNTIPVFRAMPNTAIAIQESMTCICSVNATAAQINFVTEAFNQLGKSALIEEKLMDAATVLGACGTAYAMRYIRANIQGGIEIGFSAKVASLIAAQTVKGAAELLLQKIHIPNRKLIK